MFDQGRDQVNSIGGVELGMTDDQWNSYVEYVGDWDGSNEAAVVVGDGLGFSNKSLPNSTFVSKIKT